MIYKLLRYFAPLLSGSFLLVQSFQSSASSSNAFIAGSLGDSISTAFNSTGLGNRKKDAWSAGTSQKYVRSHYLRLKQLMTHSDVQVENQSVAGSKSADLPGQAEILAAKSPSYATILIGANDLCDWASDADADFAQVDKNIDQAIQTLVAANSQSKILLVPVPDMHRLWAVGADNSCQWKWDAFSICSPLLGSDRTDEERAAFVQRWRTYNQTLAAVAARYPQQVKFDPEVSKISFEINHISSIDCFHPSGEGQDLIAKKTWESGWFGGESARWMSASVLSFDSFEPKNLAVRPKFQ